ncbi:MAG TPA: DUF3857 domain-containing protein [Chitinophagales bacterium]|nr:DUF3857 domain-containing protein [Chitinophagales bacterium]
MKNMRKPFSLVALFFIFLLPTANARITDMLTTIPDSLKKNASSVVLLEKTTFEVQSVTSALKTVHREVMILNEQGAYAGNFSESYDKFKAITAIEITHYNTAGEKIKRYTRTDLKDYSAMGSSTLMSDQRILGLSINSAQYPYRVTIDYTANYHGFISVPGWFPQEQHQSVMNAIYLLSVPEDYVFRYQLSNYSAEPQINSSKGNVVYAWSLKNIPSFKVEKYGPAGADQAISLAVAPASFSIDNYEGSTASWQTFGSWYYNLSKGRQKLSAENISKINSLVHGISDPAEKTKVLYSWLQQNTRYVNIVLGIGGWQPLSADFVSEHGYGDCKALTNYMQAILSAANITSFPALASANNDDIDVSFTSNQFNHVILAVPSAKDTLWLECTSQQLPFNFLSTFTENRHVLLIKPEGGYIVKTPATRAEDNYALNQFTADLSDPKNATISIDMKFLGNEAIDNHLSLAELADDKKLDELRERAGLPNFTISKFEYSPFNKDQVSGAVHLEATVPEFSQITSSRIFFSPFVIPAWYSTFSQEGKRKFPVEFEYPYHNKLEGSFKIPDGYKIESLPKNVDTDNEFFSYQTGFAISGNTITVQYSIKVKQAQIPASQFEAFNTLINQVISDQKKKIVLVKS